jgi:hypothetical protein
MKPKYLLSTRRKEQVVWDLDETSNDKESLPNLLKSMTKHFTSCKGTKRGKIHPKILCQIAREEGRGSIKITILKSKNELARPKSKS